MLPGISATGQRLCTDCAGGLGDYTCTRCGQEGWRHYAGICGRCVLTDRLTAILDNGTGTIRPELMPLFESICAMSRPRSGILWLSKPHVPPILQALAHGTFRSPTTGSAPSPPGAQSPTSATSSSPAAPCHRSTVSCSCSSNGYQSGSTPSTIPNTANSCTASPPGTSSDASEPPPRPGPIGHYRNQNARSELRQAAAFLTNLSARGRDPQQCTQADLDRWFATAPRTAGQGARAFLRWAIDHHHIPRLTLPATVTGHSPPISNRQRIDLIRRIHTDPTIAPIDRVIALLILLYAQPLTRIVRLTLADITHDGDQLLIRLGDPPIPVPEPFADIITTYLASRPNLTTATNPDSQLLFPGRRAGQPIHPTSIRLRLQNLGIPNLNARTRAIRELLLQAPAPVVATMLNYNNQRAQGSPPKPAPPGRPTPPADHT